MSSILTSKSRITLHEKIFELDEPEAFLLTNQKIIIFSSDLKYLLFDCLHNKLISHGQFPQQLALDEQKINNIYSYWFCHYENNTVLYYSITDKTFRQFNLEEPLSTPINWSETIIEIPREYIHNFIWVNYRQNTQTIYLLFMQDKDTIIYNKITKEQINKVGQIQCTNVNLMTLYKNIMCFACNNSAGNAVPFYYASEDSIALFWFYKNSDLSN